MARSARRKACNSTATMSTQNSSTLDIIEVHSTDENVQRSPSIAEIKLRRRIRNINNYLSPLLHLGMTRARRILKDNLDDSVIFLDETSSDAKERTIDIDVSASTSVDLDKTALEREDTVIILSDSEGEDSDKTFTNRNETEPNSSKKSEHNAQSGRLNSPKRDSSQAELFIVEERPVKKAKLTKDSSTSPIACSAKDCTGQSILDNTNNKSIGSPKGVKMSKGPGFKIDKEGNESNLHCLNAKSKSLKKPRADRAIENNPNWARFINAQNSSKDECQSSWLGNPSTNGRGCYYNSETIVRKPGSLRDIVIDGSNVAMAYTQNKVFSEEGIKLVIDYFKMRGHNVKVFVPQHVRSMRHVMLEKLYDDGIVVFTPSRRIAGKTIVSYDDRFILDYATMRDGIVVSQDQYRDMWSENPAWRNTIEKRLLVPTFVEKCVMFPEDPLGRGGPTLEKFLRHQ